MHGLGIRHLDFVTIYTKNLAASREFYAERLKFPIMREVPNEFFQIDVAGVPICVDLDITRPHQNNFGVIVEDLAATEAALRERNLTVDRGQGSNSQEQCLGVKDPDGNEIIFLVRQPNRKH